MTDDFDEPHVEVARDRFGRYLLPDPKNGSSIPWTRVTTLARTLTDEYTLNEWRRRQVLIGIGQRPDLAALAAATHRDDRKQLDEIANRAEEVAGSSAGASLGRALHSFSQKLDGRGELAGPSQYHPYLAAYVRALGLAGYSTTPEYIERIVINPEIKVAGQFDRLLIPKRSTHIPEKLVIGDLKTAKLDSIKYAWLEISIQLATYAHSTLMWDQTEKRYVAMPPVDLGYAIVMHLPHDLPPDKARCDLYRVDIIKGWECALIAHEVRQHRSASKGYVTLITPPPALAEKVAEVRPDMNSYGVCQTTVNGERFGCGKVHEGPGQVCTSCAMELLNIMNAGAQMEEICAACSDEFMSSGGDLCPNCCALPPVNSPLDRVMACTSRAELSELWAEGKEMGWWTPELTIAGKARLSEMT